MTAILTLALFGLAIVVSAMVGATYVTSYERGYHRGFSDGSEMGDVASSARKRR